MKLAHAAAFLLAALAPVALAQDQEVFNFDSIHNATSLEGTWSSGSQAVLTGSVSFSPARRRSPAFCRTEEAAGTRG